MTTQDTKVGPNRGWVWVLGILLLLGVLAALWSCAGSEVAKTTIRITKGKPKMASQWEVTIEIGATTSAEQFKEGGPIPADIWRRMNGTITKFTKAECDGSTATVTELRYKTKDEAAGKINEVCLQEKADHKPDWDFTSCDLNKDCTLPARYFHGVVYGEGENECPKPDQNVVWIVELE